MRFYVFYSTWIDRFLFQSSFRRTEPKSRSKFDKFESAKNLTNKHERMVGDISNKHRRWLQWWIIPTIPSHYIKHGGILYNRFFLFQVEEHNSHFRWIMFNPPHFHLRNCGGFAGAMMKRLRAAVRRDVEAAHWRSMATKWAKISLHSLGVLASKNQTWWKGLQW